MSVPLPTDFAPAERAEEKDIHEAATLLQSNPLIAMINAVPIPLIIINEQRQAVFCNSKFRATSILNSAEEVYGMRPGEALGCIHSHVHEGGCGTSMFCRDCGAASAIIQSLRGNSSTEECRILRHNEFEEEALDLQVFTSPFKYMEKNFILFTALDIGHEKRKLCLEHVFYHDILNLVTGLKYSAQMVCRTTTTDKISSQCQKMDRALSQIAEEIHAQKALSNAEEGNLKVIPRITSTGAMLTNMRELYTGHGLCAGKFITIEAESIETELETDPVILTRILGNMIKNALEATEDGGTVTLGADSQPSRVVFWVHNDQVIPEKVQRQIFKRSFSTKGTGRGLGTYSMKLLAESYLKGSISFNSEKFVGTTFSVYLPEEGLR